MADLSFANVKIHNEIELLSISDRKAKRMLEHLFLENRISYFEKWEEVGFIRRFFWGEEKNRCIFCVNEMQMEKAMRLLDENPQIMEKADLIKKRVDKTYF